MNTLKREAYGLSIRFPSDDKYHSEQAIDTLEQYLSRIVSNYRYKTKFLNGRFFSAKIKDGLYLNCLVSDDKFMFSLLNVGKKAQVHEISADIAEKLIPYMKDTVSKLSTRIDALGLKNNNPTYAQDEWIKECWQNYLQSDFDVTKDDVIER